MNYTVITRSIVFGLVVAVLALGCIALLGIWEVIDNEDVIWKALTSMITLTVVGAVALGSLKFLEDWEQKRR